MVNNFRMTLRFLKPRALVRGAVVHNAKKGDQDEVSDNTKFTNMTDHKNRTRRLSK
jgi:hypothetical protein